ncbi:hypothetical protein [Carboxylicivirga marina]|uniref:hypothetical protein n=1 Tax=Carboxylicivirga marina TaxID=2800988 RepID=UPI0025941184|nr:hypothetical protein [uncultured Carboxylicivirga sp.]
MKRRKTYIIILIVTLLIGIRVYRQYQAETLRIEDYVYSDIQERIDIDSGIVCILIPQKTYYRIGEKPQLDVLIINKTDSTIYLPGCLDGSDIRTRLPYCDFLVSNKNILKPQKWIDVSPNPLINLDLQKLSPNDCFNPLSDYKLKSFKINKDNALNLPETTFSQLYNFWEPQSLQGRNFLLPGNYEIQFIYSTIPDENILFDWNVSCNDFEQLNIDLIDSIPEIKIQSNTVKLKYRFL